MSDIAASGTTPRWRKLSVRVRTLDAHSVRLALLVYGVAIALLGAWHLTRTLPDSWTMMGMRAAGVQESIHVLDNGGPPLLAKGGPSVLTTDQHVVTATQYTYYKLPRSDDAGLYLYIPLVGHAIGVDNPHLLVKWLFVALFTLLLLVYPIVVFEIFASVLAAVAAPLLVLFRIDFLSNSDIYWIPAWAVLFSLPIVLALARRAWSVKLVACLAGLLLMLGFATAIRGHSGLPGAIAALVVGVVKAPGWRKRAVTAAVLLVAYAAATPIGVDIARTVRDHDLQGTPKVTVAPDIAPQPTGWHVLYIGLGYLPNKYGITYDDSSGYRAALRAKPHVEYLSPAYRDTMRHLYLHIVRTNPTFVIRTYLAKARQAFSDAAHNFTLALLLVPMMLVVGRRRRAFRRDVLLASPAVIVTLVSPIVALPARNSFELGWLGTMFFFWLFGILWAVAEVHAGALSALRGRRLPTLSPRIFQTSQIPKVAHSSRFWLSVTTVAALLSLWFGPLARWLDEGRAVRSEAAFYRSVIAPLAARARRPASTLRRWSFARGLPPGWIALSGTRVRAGATDRTLVDTTKGRFDYQLLSPILTLPPGSYEARARGVVRTGGLQIGVLDEHRNAWLATSNYWHAQRGFTRKDMATSFTLSESLRVKVILANVQPQGRPSQWLLRRVLIMRAQP